MAESGPEPTVRVLVLNDVKICRFVVNSPFQVLQGPGSGLSDSLKKHFHSTENDLEIRVSEGEIKIGNAVFRSKTLYIQPEEPRL
ncbi:MAG: hypothetical protein ACYS8Z_06920, partial [Planctomycetota bacterium]